MKTSYLVQRYQRVDRSNFVWRVCREEIRNVEDAKVAIAIARQDEPLVVFRLVRVTEEVLSSSEMIQAGNRSLAAVMLSSGIL